MKKNKTFDSVAMKRKAAERIERMLRGKTLSERLAFWKEQTEKLMKRKAKLVAEDSAPSIVAEPKSKYGKK